MDYLQARDAVWGAFKHGEIERGNLLLEEYLASQQGEELGRAMTLKAAVIGVFCPSRTAEGLALIDEALPLVRRNPLYTAVSLKNGLGMAFVAGDAHRAEPYEESACRLLLEYGTHPEIRPLRYGLQLNLGLVASIRADHATAYWYLVQASNSLSVPEIGDRERHFWEFQIQSQIALSCLRVRRFYEAQEALDLAEACSEGHPQRHRLPIYRAELFRQMGLTNEARDLLESISGKVTESNNMDILTWYHWVAALVAQDLGDLSSCFRSLSKARDLAVENCYDYLLGDIQRFGRNQNYQRNWGEIK